MYGGSSQRGSLFSVACYWSTLDTHALEAVLVYGPVLHWSLFGTAYVSGILMHTYKYVYAHSSLSFEHQHRLTDITVTSVSRR